MNPTLFLKLLEKQLLKTGTELGVEYIKYQDGKKVGTVKGMYTIERFTPHPLGYMPIVHIKNDLEQAEVDIKNIKLIAGLSPNKYAAEYGIRPDGKESDAPKRRGRKPKDRNPEKVWSCD